MSIDADAREIALAYDDPRHLTASRFLVAEAALLDGRRWRAWLGLLTSDVRYVMPVQVTTAAGVTPRAPNTMAHFDDDLHSLTKRVERLTTDYAWTEDPPSRTRHIVSNVLTFTTESADTLRVESSLLLFRSRGDTRPPEILCAGRIDRLRASDDGYRLAERVIDVDEAVLRTQNLAIFL